MIKPSSVEIRRQPLLYRRLHRTWRDVEWMILAGLWLAAIGLGYWGFSASGLEFAQTPFDCLYLTLQLISLNSGGIPSAVVSWSLQAARFLLPALAAYTALKTLAVVFRQQLQLTRLVNIHNHVVICGLSSKGFLLVKGFIERGDNVVVIEQDEENILLEQCRQRGAIVLVGDATDKVLLYKAAVHRAHLLFAVCDDDGINAEVAVQTRDLLSERGGQRVLTCVVHLVDPQLCRLMREHEIAIEQTPNFRLELFNVFDHGARLLMQEFFPASLEGVGFPQTPHWLLVGLGRMGESLILQAALRWREYYPVVKRRFQITIIDREAGWKCESLVLRYPHLSRLFDIQPLSMNVRSPEFQRASFLFDDQHRCQMDLVFITMDDNVLNLNTALMLIKRMNSVCVPVVVRSTEGSGLAKLIMDSRTVSDNIKNLHIFGLLDSTCTPDLLLGGTHELLAEALQNEKIQQQVILGQSAAKNPALQPWNLLGESYKEAVRKQVDHLGVMLHTVGCVIKPMADWDAPLISFTESEVESMAQIQHQHWAEDKTNHGWHFAESQPNDLKKTHPYLLVWDDLPIAERQKQLTQVRGIPSFLARAGFQVVRNYG